MAATELPARPSVWGHLRIARPGHWIKNVFVLPGVLAGMTLMPWDDPQGLAYRFVVGMLAVCLIASSNYTINEVLDAPFDRKHPTKKLRGVPAGEVSVPWAYVQWIALLAGGLFLSWQVGPLFVATMAALWLMGCAYNIPPVRSKDKPYLDVLSEAVNNPLRLLAGWFIVGSSALPPASLLVSYWFVGCYFMAIKRYAELREIDKTTAGHYRESFKYYTPERLLNSIVFYGSMAMLFFGAFSIRYRKELILSYPFIAWVMAVYMGLAFKADSSAQAPEKLYKEPSILISVTICALVIALGFLIDIPPLGYWLQPSVEPQK